MSDLISREALLKAMEMERQYLLARGETGAEHILVHHCLPLIDNAPTIEPFERIGSICEENCGYRPQGKWIFGECSVCGKFINKASKYCSNCGAKMINCSMWNIPPEEKNNEI